MLTQVVIMISNVRRRENASCVGVGVVIKKIVMRILFRVSMRMMVIRMLTMVVMMVTTAANWRFVKNYNL